LLKRLAAISEEAGYWTLQSQIMAVNAGSLALHRKCGFREVGCRERYGHLNGVWHDLVLFERRSLRAGGPGLPTRSCD